MPSWLWSCNNSSFPLPAIVFPLFRDTNAYSETPIPRFKDTRSNVVFVADPQLSWRAARVRESREPAPRMGRVSFVQTARGDKLFPVAFSVCGHFGCLLTGCQIRHSKGTIGNKIGLQAVVPNEWDNPWEWVGRVGCARAGALRAARFAPPRRRL